MSLFNYIFELVIAGGLPILFLLVMLEGNPIIGSFIPGQVLTVFMGVALADQFTFLQLLGAILLIFIGALIGDVAGYYLGKKCSGNKLKKFGISEDKTIYKSSYKFFKKYGIWSIILGRELNFTRSFMPFFAGSFKMPIKKFLITTTFSCFIWSAMSLSLGYYFGSVVFKQFQFFMEFIMFLIVYLSIISFIYGKFRMFYEENLTLIKKHALQNIFYFSLFVPFFIVMIYIIRFAYIQVFNDFFSFIYVPGLYYFTSFMYSTWFILLGFISFFGFLVYKKKFKLLSSSFWSLFIISIINYVLFIFFDKNYGLEVYTPIVYFSLLMFYLWILFKRFIKIESIVNLLSFFLILICLTILISFFSKTSNLFFVIFSFIIGVIETELILILSHYKFLDNELTIKQE